MTLPRLLLLVVVWSRVRSRLVLLDPQCLKPVSAEALIGAVNLSPSRPPKLRHRSLALLKEEMTKLKLLPPRVRAQVVGRGRASPIATLSPFSRDRVDRTL